MKILPLGIEKDLTIEHEHDIIPTELPENRKICDNWKN